MPKNSTPKFTLPHTDYREYVERVEIADAETGDSTFLNLVDAKVVAAYLGLALKTIRNLTSSGRIPCYQLSGKCVRYNLAEVNAWALRRRRLSKEAA